MSRKSSLRHRGTSSFSFGTEYPNYLPIFREPSEIEVPVGRRNSSFLTEKSIELEQEQDVKTDVLYPRHTAHEDKVDMDAFGRMVKKRKFSTNSIQLTRTLSKQAQLYGSSKYFEQPTGVRFQLYSFDKNSNISSGLEDLLTDKGQRILDSVIKLKSWWIDILCPSDEEMRILSKTFHIHPLTAEDIQAQEPREKVELFPNYTFVCFKSFEVDPITDQIKPFNYYCLIFKDGFLSFHYKKSDHVDVVRARCNQLKEYMMITPDWLNYALIDAITDSFAPFILQIEMDAVSIEELSFVLNKSEQGDMLKRISRCRKKSTQLSRLLSSKLDVIKSLMKRYEDKHRELDLMEQQQSFPIQLNHALLNINNNNNKKKSSPFDTHSNQSLSSMMESKKTFSDVLLYLGDIQDHVVTMVQNINHYDRILHRAHTNYLALVNLELTETYNMTNSVMNRLTFMATIFIPLTIICSLWGMNVHVPGKNYEDSVYFYWILGGMSVYTIGCIYYGKRLGLL